MSSSKGFDDHQPAIGARNQCEPLSVVDGVAGAAYVVLNNAAF
jgi:hypothetical protein